jgi:hypothetical protein
MQVAVMDVQQSGKRRGINARIVIHCHTMALLLLATMLSSMGGQESNFVWRLRHYVSKWRQLV